jgi:hypothetical protein
MASPLPVSTSAWRCRVCDYERYHRVAVLRKNGTRYETEFFACSQCSVMFLNPSQFNTYSTAAPNIEFPPIVTRLRKQRAKPSNRPLTIHAP